MAELPTGTITFLFTDIEKSTRHWELRPEAMAAALPRHNHIIRSAVEAAGGTLVKSRGEGDSTFSAFPSAGAALAAACELQRALLQEEWSEGAVIAVRAALHTGSVVPTDGDYNHVAVNRCARIRALAAGSQTLLSQAVVDAARHSLPAGVNFLDLGVHRLKDLDQPERVYQLLFSDLPTEFPALPSLGGLPTNLPQQLSTFVGREEELAEVRGLIQRSRLVSALGAGGVGKTRLALQAAADSLDDFPDGVWLVELADLRDPELVPAAMASVLGIREEGRREIRETLLEYLAARKLLLILDNCEHLIESTAELVGLLLRRCPKLRILTTSQEALSVPGEAPYRVPSLSVPTSVSLTADPLAAARDCAAIRLFVDRAQAQRPGFSLNKKNARAIAEICRRLDGIPLAIELAAARVRVLTIEEIAARLNDRFRLLSGTVRGVLPRHRTLRAAMEWSYDLLLEDERAMLRRFSVFAGGATLQSAEAILPHPNPVSFDPERGDPPGEPDDGAEILDVLARLSDKSLLVHESREGRGRYRLLESIRDYSTERLEENPGELILVHDGHAFYYLKFAEEKALSMRQPGEMNALAEMTDDIDNLRAAIRWSHGREMGIVCARLALAVHELLYRRSLWAEARQYLDMADSLLDANETGSQARQLSAVLKQKLGAIALDMGDCARARHWLEASLTISRDALNSDSSSETLNVLGLVALEERDQQQAGRYFEEALRLSQDRGRRDRILHNLGLLAARQGELERARDFYGEALKSRRALGDHRGEAETLGGLGSLAHREENRKEARRLYGESLDLREQLQDWFGVGVVLNNLGDLAERDGDLDSALRYYMQARTIFRDMQAAAASVPDEAIGKLTAGLDPNHFRDLEQQAVELVISRRMSGNR